MFTILIVTTGLAYGGAETQLVSLAIELRKRGNIVEIASMLTPTAFLDKLESAGIKVHNLKMQRGKPDINALIKLNKIIRLVQPNIIHSHMVHANFLARTVRIFTKIPALICTAHSINEGGRIRELAYKATDFLCDITTQVSIAGMERYIKIGATPSNKITFIPNGVNTNNFKKDSHEREQTRNSLGLSDKFIWLAVGRFDEPKDYKTLITAFSMLNHTNTALVIAGDGPLRKECEDLSLSLNKTSLIKFLGIRDDIPSLMNAADAYVMSSIWEGMPSVLLEASSIGLPIVATNVGGIPEIIQEGTTGFLSPPSNPSSLAQSMQRMMTLDTKSRSNIGNNAMNFVAKTYNLERVVDQWESLYAKILKQKKII